MHHAYAIFIYTISTNENNINWKKTKICKNMGTDYILQCYKPKEETFSQHLILLLGTVWRDYYLRNYKVNCVYQLTYDCKISFLII